MNEREEGLISKVNQNPARFNFLKMAVLFPMTGKQLVKDGGFSRARK